MRRAERSVSGAAAAATALVALALALGGCQKQTNQLVVVTADFPADAADLGVDKLTVILGTTNRTYDLPPTLLTQLIKDGVSVGVYIPDSVTGNQTVYVTASHGTAECGPGYAGSQKFAISQSGASHVIVAMTAQTVCPSGSGGAGGGGTSGSAGSGGTSGSAGSSGSAGTTGSAGASAGAAGTTGAGGGTAGNGGRGGGGAGTGGGGTAGGGTVGTGGHGGAGTGGGGTGGGAAGSGGHGGAGTGGGGAAGVGTAGSGGRGGGGAGTGGGGTTPVAPTFGACIEVDHGDPGTCSSCALNPAADVQVNGVAFSPTDPSLVATGASDGRVKIWRYANGTLTQLTMLTGSGPGAVAFSPDGATLAVGRTGGVDIVSVSDWTVQRTLITYSGFPSGAVAFSPDGANVFTAALAVSPSTGGALVVHAVGNVQFLVIQAVAKAVSLAVPPATVGGVVPVAVTDGNGKVSFFNWSPSAKTLSSLAAKLSVTIDGSVARAAAFWAQAAAAQGAVFAAAGDDGVVNVWNYPAMTNAFPNVVSNLTAFVSSRTVGAIAFTPAYGWIAAGGESFGTLSAYTLSSGGKTGRQFDTQYDVISMAFSPNSNVLVAGEANCGCIAVCPQ